MRVSLFLDHACNLACSYCYNGEHFHRVMSEEVALAGVELALSSGPSRLSFFGGEPLLHLDLIQQLHGRASALAAERGVDLAYLVVTNGTLLTEDTLDWLLAHDFYVAASLDGTREAHDAARRYPDGRSSYEVVVPNLQRLWARRPGSKVMAVIHPGNTHLMGESFTTLLELGARNLSMNLDYEADWDEAAREGFLVGLRALGDAWVEAWRQGRHHTLNLLDSKIISHIKGGFADSDRCDFGCEEVAVSPRGRLYPCDRLVGMDDRDELVIGDVWSGVDPVRRDAHIASKNAVLGDCLSCSLLGRCMHWCGCVNYALTGSVGGVSGLLCWFEQRIVEEADRCAAILFAEENPGFLARFYAPRLRPRPTPRGVGSLRADAVGRSQGRR